MEKQAQICIDIIRVVLNIDIVIYLAYRYVFSIHMEGGREGESGERADGADVLSHSAVRLPECDPHVRSSAV